MGVLEQLSQLERSHEWPMLVQFAVWVLPVWLLGTLTGWLLPRPKTWNGHALFASLGYIGGLKRIALAINGLLIVRECWYRVFEAGTFRLFAKAVWLWFCGRGWTFDFPHARDPSPKSQGSEAPAAGDNWYVGASDLDLFKRTCEGPTCDGPQPGAGWEVLMEKHLPIIKYKCWRRTLPNGKTEYMSHTVSPDATAEEFTDMYFDDDDRPNWDTMIVEHEVLERGDAAQRQLVVRWLRKFPFSFISSREYTIARRLFRQDDALYSISKACDHPRAKRDSNVVRMDVFYSMWRARTVPCPWGSDKPACETVLLHHEQFKIPENLARFAAKHGMWGFVHKMAQSTPTYVAQRRTRCAPHQLDPKPYGCDAPPHPPTTPNSGCSSHGGGCYGGGVPLSRSASMPLRSSHSAASMCSLTRAASMLTIVEDASSETASSEGSPGHLSSRREAPSKSKTFKGFAAFAVASSLAIIMRRSSSCTSFQAASLVGSLEAAVGEDRARRLRNRRNRHRYSDTGYTSTPLW